jgi:hypothetical protein
MLLSTVASPVSQPGHRSNYTFLRYKYLLQVGGSAPDNNWIQYLTLGVCIVDKFERALWYCISRRIVNKYVTLRNLFATCSHWGSQFIVSLIITPRSLQFFTASTSVPWISRLGCTIFLVWCVCICMTFVLPAFMLNKFSSANLANSLFTNSLFTLIVFVLASC